MHTRGQDNHLIAVTIRAGTHVRPYRLTSFHCGATNQFLTIANGRIDTHVTSSSGQSCVQTAAMATVVLYFSFIAEKSRCNLRCKFRRVRFNGRERRQSASVRKLCASYQCTKLAHLRFLMRFEESKIRCKIRRVNEKPYYLPFIYQRVLFSYIPRRTFFVSQSSRNTIENSLLCRKRYIYHRFSLVSFHYQISVIDGYTCGLEYRGGNNWKRLKE